MQLRTPKGVEPVEPMSACCDGRWRGTCRLPALGPAAMPLGGNELPGKPAWQVAATKSVPTQVI